jgi:hypothetical protein
VRNVPEEQMGAVMGIACPQIVYPYLRGNVADLIKRAGFPPVHLAEINFQAMYEQQQAQPSRRRPRPCRSKHQTGLLRLMVVSASSYENHSHRCRRLGHGPGRSAPRATRPATK